MAGLMSTATRVAAGTSSRRSSSRFAANSPTKKLIPVRLPPGRARLATRPSLTGSSETAKTMGIVVVAALARECCGGRRSQQSRRLVGEPVRPPAPAVGHIDPPPSDIDRHVLALDIAGILQALAECAQTVERVRRLGCRGIRSPASPAAARAPRAASCRRAAEQRDELAPPHSITSSARASSVGGTVEAERLGGLEVDHQLVLGRRLHRQVGRLLALEDAVDIAGRAPVLVDVIGPIGDQAAGSERRNVRSRPRAVCAGPPAR